MTLCGGSTQNKCVICNKYTITCLLNIEVSFYIVVDSAIYLHSTEFHRLPSKIIIENTKIMTRLAREGYVGGVI